MVKTMSLEGVDERRREGDYIGDGGIQGGDREVGGLLNVYRAGR